MLCGSLGGKKVLKKVKINFEQHELFWRLATPLGASTVVDLGGLGGEPKEAR